MTYGFSVGDILLYSSMKILMEGSRQFFWRTLSVNKSIGKIMTNELINMPQITDESFFDGLFLSTSPSVKFMLTDFYYKHQ